MSVSSEAKLKRWFQFVPKFIPLIQYCERLTLVSMNEKRYILMTFNKSFDVWKSYRSWLRSTNSCHDALVPLVNALIAPFLGYI